MAPRGLPHGAPLLRGLALQPLCSPPCVASGAALRQPGNTPAHRPSLPPRPRPAQAQAWGTDSSTWWAKLHVFELLCHFVPSHVAASPLSLSPGGSVALRLCRADSAASLLAGPSSCSVPSRLLSHLPERTFKSDDDG